MAEPGDPYRSFPDRDPPAIIDCRLLSPWWSGGATAAFALLLIASARSPGADSLAVLLLILPVGALFSHFSRRVRVIVDAAARQVRMQRSRFPLAPREEVFAIDEVTGAELEESSEDSGGAVYRVALVLVDGRRVPLTSSYTSERASTEVVERITEALQASGR